MLSGKSLLSLSAYAYCRNAAPIRVDINGTEDMPATEGHTADCSISGCDGGYSGTIPATSINPYQFNSTLPATSIFDADYQLVEWHCSVIFVDDVQARDYEKTCKRLSKVYELSDVVCTVTAGLAFPSDIWLPATKYEAQVAAGIKAIGIGKGILEPFVSIEQDMTYDTAPAPSDPSAGIPAHGQG